MKSYIWSFFCVVFAVSLWGCSGPSNILHSDLENDSIGIGSEAGRARTGTFKLFQTWSSPVKITKFEVVGAQAILFQVVRPTSLPFTLSPGKDKAQEVTVQFFPDKVGDYRAELEISFETEDGYGRHDLTIRLVGKAKSTAEFGVLSTNATKGVFDFGEVMTDVVNIKELQLFNTTKYPITITSLKIVDDKEGVFKLAFPPPLPFTVLSGKENARIFLLQVEGKKEGTFEAHLHVASPNAKNATREGTNLIKIKVKVIPFRKPGMLDYDKEAASKLKFRDVPNGETQTKEFNIYNAGDMPLTIESLAFTSDAGGKFKVVTPTKVPFSLEAGKEKGVKVKVSFTAGKEEGHSQGVLAIISFDPRYSENKRTLTFNVTHEISIVAFAISCSEGLDLGKVKKDGLGVNTCRVQSTGNVALEMKSVSFTKTKGNEKHFQWHYPTLPVTLSPGSNSYIQIWYKPSTVPSVDEGVFVVETNIKNPSENQKLKIKVKGEGIK